MMNESAPQDRQRHEQPETFRRRLSDRIEEAFDQACNQGQIEVAACMLKGLDMALLGQPQSWNRRHVALSVLRACQARLEQLRLSQDLARNESSPTTKAA